MRKNDQMLLAALLSIGLLVAFWLIVVSPKRHEAASLKDDISGLQGQLAEAQQSATAGAASRKSFDTNYRRLVVLGKAVPADSEQASLLVQLQRLADRAGVGFQTFDLSSSESSAPAPVSPTPPSEPATGTAGDTTTPVAAPAVPTEASAATLPIGASVGPAGLAVMPYDLTFTGGFFEIADFMRRVDSMVHMRGGLAGVNGRLVTIDGFTLTPQAVGTTASASPKAAATPILGAQLTVTTYLTPADQGITAGATPSGPAPATPTPTSTTPSTSTSTPTSDTTAVTP
jgi:Tfp pilus assembly protein PilO